MIGALSRVASFIGIPAPLVFFAVYGVIIAAVGSTYGYVYYKGYSAATASCRSAELERELYAQAQTIVRYRQAVEQTEKQAEQEIREAMERERLIAERMKAEESDDAMLEAALTAAITDKEKLNGIIQNLRKKCTATNSDVDLDKRLRGK